ncbi:Basic-leucine zipper domain [Arabidopsis thaliana x Arabidopsis arenosa]|uniref:Basic-leucine zipper domain n=1 Tax=Arabidopsis thaliana x Arabidopsis arenosa TaxID=1240361 RepID=A0A8T1XY44_9BRAS|nr:Basic-leucine zipper domain [Arabidopsis thaliana x Arabidopsis arenosa]
MTKLPLWFVHKYQAPTMQFFPFPLLISLISLLEKILAIMLSTVPAFSFSEPGLVNQFSGFQTGFTPWEWDCSDLFSVDQMFLEPAVPSPCYGESDTGSVKINSGSHDMKTGSDESCAGFVKTNSGFDDADRSNGLPCSQADEPDSDDSKQLTAITNFGSGEHNHNRKKMIQPEMTDEQKRKRMESNRESAKRSRMRKQSHIDNLRDQVNRLNLENRELGNRLQLVLYQLQRVNSDNNRLVTEQEILRLRLSEMRRILIIRQLQQQQQWELHNRRMIMTEQNHPHLQ